MNYFIMGHEASGIIVKTGKNVICWKEGDEFDLST